MARSSKRWSKVQGITGVYEDRAGRFMVRASFRDPVTRTFLERERLLQPGAELEDAQIAFLELKRDLRTGQTQETPSRTTEMPTVAGYAERWMARKSKRLRASTRITYSNSVAEFLVDHGAIPFDALTREHVEDWVAKLEHARKRDGDYYALDSVRCWYRVAKKLIRDAVADLRLPHDPTDRVVGPRRQVHHIGSRREKRTLTHTQLGALLAHIEEHTPDRYAEVLTLAYTGIRAGELYALQWPHVDLSGGILAVELSVARGEVNLTKTDDPRRVPLPEAVVDAMRSHRRAQLDGRAVQSMNLVFPSYKGTHRTPSSLNRTFDHACKANGIDIRVRPQVLRRTFNTLLIAAGVDRIVQRSIMGHTTEEMTQRYAGIPMQHKRQALNQLLQNRRP